MLLEGVLGLYPQFARHLVALVGIHIGIELLVVARDGAPYGGGVGDEDGLDLGGVQVQPKEAQPRLPLVEERDLLLGLVVAEDALHDARSGHGEEAGLVVVAIALIPLDAVLLPGFEVELSLLLPQGLEVDEDDGGLARYRPAPYD